jgi:hypothetical protein
MEEYMSIADIPKNHYEVKAVAESLIPRYRIAAGADELSREFFEEHDKNEWWLNGAPIRNWKRLLEGKVKRIREQERGKIKPNYHKLRFAVCDICWDPMRNHGIEGLRECDCVSRCIKNDAKIKALMKDGAKPSKMLMFIYEGRLNVMDDDDVEAVELYYRCSRVRYITVFNSNPTALEVYEHIRHFHERMIKEYGAEYNERVMPIKRLMAERG